MGDALEIRNETWGYIEKTLERQYGRAYLGEGSNPRDKVIAFFRLCKVEEVLDVIELFLTEIRSSVRPNAPYFSENLSHINELFKEYGIGYEFVEQTAQEVFAVRIDSKHLHATAIKKTMKLLYDLNFEGPLREFDDALEALDNQDFDGAVTLANKAFESTMKAILEELQHQPYDPTWPASKLISALVEADVVPSRFLSFSDGIRTVLEAGLPAMRNAPGVAHGSGPDLKDIERSYAQFAVNLCGSYIVFLIERYEEKK
jgi:hypothetical protein